MALRVGATFLLLLTSAFGGCAGDEPSTPRQVSSDASVRWDATTVEAGRGATPDQGTPSREGLATTPTWPVATQTTAARGRGIDAVDGLGVVDTSTLPARAADAVKARPAELSSLAIASSVAGIRALLGPVQAATHHGRLRVLEDGGMVMGLAGASDAGLEASQRAWRGRIVRVWTADRRSCSGRVTALEYATPWIWKEELLGEQAMGDATSALEDAWLSVLVARVTLDDPTACPGRPLLVHDATRQAPRIAESLPKVPRQRQIMSAFRRLPRYRALQRQCPSDPACALDAAGGRAPHRDVSLQAFRFPGESQVYVVASVAEGICGAWGPPMSAIFSMEPARHLPPQLRRVNKRAELGSAEILLDIEGDGRLELLTQRFAGDLELIDEEGATLSLWSTIFVGCHC